MRSHDLRRPTVGLVAIVGLLLWSTCPAECLGEVLEAEHAFQVELSSSETDVETASAEFRIEEASEESDSESPASESAQSLGVPTHKQVGVINVNSSGLAQTSLHCFCLSTNGEILAACGSESGEIRVFDPAGEYLTSWDVPVKPEAINVGSDGNIYIAGSGKLFKFSAEGELLLQKDSPHAEEIAANAEKIREEVINQASRMKTAVEQQLKTYEDQITALRDKGEEALSELEKQQLQSLEQVKEQFVEMAKQYDGVELSEKELESQVASMIQYKLRTASIGEYGGHVFIATGSPQGYGFSVWKMDDNFENGETIVTGLSGCCGQMDVQACENGLFVAENSRHRVVRYDHDGKQITSWGKQARKGLRGFDSCCNPMNVAFGPEGSVYTAESTSGRIKTYSPDGELLALVGKVDLVPGCKKVAIGVSENGDRVYMLDITRNHILMMDRLKPGQSVAYREHDDGERGSFFDALKGAFGF